MKPPAPPKARGIRQSMSDLHIWTGLLMGWLLYAVFLTGTVSYFRDEISLWMRPDVPAHARTPDAVQVTRRMVAQLQQQAPHAVQWGIVLPTSRQPAVTLFWRDGPRRFRELLLDPVTAAPLTRRETLGGDFFYRFHFNLHYVSPTTGRWIVGVAAMFMLVALISGIITHKKILTEFFTFRWGKGQRSWLDAHNALGVLGLPFHLVITYSGLVTLMLLYMPWGAMTAVHADPTIPARSRQALSGFLPSASPTQTRAPLTDLAPLVAQARARWGEHGIGRVVINNPGDAGARIVLMRTDEGRVSISPQYLVFDGTTGKLLQEHVRSSAAVETRSVLVALHEGRYAHAPLRWLYVMLGLAGTGMVGSGLVLWTVKRRARLPDPQRPHFGFRVVERLNIATIAGLPLAMTAFLWGNRLLPASLTARADAEIAVFFGCWLLTALVATFRPPRRAWMELLATGSLLLALTPLLNALTTDRWLLPSLMHGDWTFALFDLSLLALAALLACIAWHTARHTPRARPTPRSGAAGKPRAVMPPAAARTEGAPSLHGAHAPSGTMRPSRRAAP